MSCNSFQIRMEETPIKKSENDIIEASLTLSASTQ